MPTDPTRLATGTTETSGATRGGRVLVVDDDRDTLRYVSRLLVDRGYLVHVADSGELALRIASAVLPDLVLLDLGLPGRFDGVETCRRLKANGDLRRVPVIFLTGNADESLMLRAFEAGGADYVLKPCTPAVLAARVAVHSELAYLSRNLETALGERTVALQAANERLHLLALELARVEASERGRLARELHDSPMQKVAIAQMHLSRATEHSDPEIAERVAVGLDLLREALEELRSLQFELSPPHLAREGLAAALRWLASHAHARFGLPLTFSEGAPLPRLDPDLELALYQCARELAHNVAKHARASGARVRLERAAAEVVLTVEDDGQGFAPSRATAPQTATGGFGLFSIRERLELFGGRLTVESGAGGTRAVMRVPLAVEASAPPVAPRNDVERDSRSTRSAAR